MLHQHLVACGEIDQDLRTGQGGPGGRRHRRPEVLADLNSQSGFSDAEELSHAEAYARLSGVVHLKTFAVQHPCRLEPARLVEFVVAGEVGLRNYAEDLSPAGHYGAVEESAAEFDRGAEDQKRLKGGGA